MFSQSKGFREQKTSGNTGLLLGRNFSQACSHPYGSRGTVHAPPLLYASNSSGISVQICRKFYVGKY